MKAFYCFQRIFRLSPCCHSSSSVARSISSAARIAVVKEVHHSAITFKQPRVPKFCSLSMSQQQAGPQSKKDYDQQWHNTWQQGLQPGQMFDAGCCSPLLTHLLENGQLSAKGKRALVPGCGRGYDVFEFAAAGATLSVGLDLSPSAIEAAQAAAQQSPKLAANPAALAAVHLVAGDFFTFSHSATSSSSTTTTNTSTSSSSSSKDSRASFDIGYDYTFLCALHPDMRGAWARSWASLLVPGGELLTLIFPVGGVPDWVLQRDPPWEVTPELYRELLVPAGFEEVVVQQVSKHLSHKARAGREWWGIWRRCADPPPGQKQQTLHSSL